MEIEDLLYTCVGHVLLSPSTVDHSLCGGHVDGTRASFSSWRFCPEAYVEVVVCAGSLRGFVPERGLVKSLKLLVFSGFLPECGVDHPHFHLAMRFTCGMAQQEVGCNVKLTVYISPLCTRGLDAS